MAERPFGVEYSKSSASWPSAFPVAPLPPMDRSVGIPLGDLSVEKRRRVWKWAKANDPALVELVSSPEYLQLREMFDATPVVSREYLDRALRETP